VLAAQRAGVPIVPVHAHAARAWRAGSWDRLLIPKPFALVRIAYGGIFEPGQGPDTIKVDEERAKQELAEAVRKAELSPE